MRAELMQRDRVTEWDFLSEQDERGQEEILQRNYGDRRRKIRRGIA